MSIKCYVARGMTGRIKEDIVKEAIADKTALENAGIIALDPVTAEGVEATKEKLVSSKKAMDVFWKRDKEMIREANVLLDMTPHLNSEGCKHELAYARYALWKPVVRVFPKGQLPFKSSIAFYEDDAVLDSLDDAIAHIKKFYDTPKKRITWRLKMLNRCFLKWAWYQILEFK